MDKTKVSEVAPPDVQVLKDKLNELVRHATVSRLKIHTDSDEVETKALDSSFRPGKILASNMVFILVSGDALRLTFKIHFNTRTGRNLALRIYGGKSAADISEKQAIDYFKEYGNLVAGSVITLLGENNIELGISLPLCTRGFYEVFSDYTEKQHPVINYSHFWELHVKEQTVFCSAQYEILNIKPFETLVEYEISEDASGDDGEMDFL
ncbi:MAG: chemotaxis protein CheX [Betaproteobacteria bacterium]